MPDESASSEHQTQPQPAKARLSRRTWAVVVVVIVVGLVLAGLQTGWFSFLPGFDAPLSGQVEANAQPVIAALAVATDRIEPGSTIPVSCSASDPDGDALAYTWSASDGQITGAGADVTWLAPDTEGLYRVFVTVDDGRGGAAQASLTLRVRSNQPPEITVMQSEVEESDGWVVPGASVYIRCEAIDPDGDALSHRWSATGGAIFGQGAAVVWQAPPSLGMQWITVVVEDIYGATAERSIPVTVSAAEPPPLNGLIASAVDTDLFRPYGDSWRIFKERSCLIEARIDDPEGVYAYEWRAELGSLVADGPRAVWTAPVSPKGWVTIVLVVSDSHGNEISDAIRIYVETCTSCM